MKSSAKAEIGYILIILLLVAIPLVWPIFVHDYELALLEAMPEEKRSPEVEDTIRQRRALVNETKAKHNRLVAVFVAVDFAAIGVIYWTLIRRRNDA